MLVTEPVCIFEISSALPGAVPVWVDVSSSLRSAKIKRGKQRQRDKSQAGTATFIVSNADRKFDPENATSPLYAFLKPMRRVRLRATWAGVTYAIYDGYIDFIEQDYNGPREATATIATTDGFKRLEGAYLPSVYESQISGEACKAWYRLDEQTNDYLGVQYLNDRSGNGYTGFKVGPVSSVAGLLAEEVNGAMKCPNNETAGVGFPTRVTPLGLPWALEFWLQAPRFDLGAAGATVDAMVIRPFQAGQAISFNPGTLNCSTRNASDGMSVDKLRVNIGTTGANALSSGVVFDNIRHHIVIVAEAGTPLKIYIDGANSTFSAAGNSEALVAQDIAFGVSKVETTWDEIRLYEGVVPTPAVIANHWAWGSSPWANDSPATRIGRVLDLIGWPVADRILSGAGSPLQRTGLGGTALAHLLLIEETELGAVFMTSTGALRYIGRNDLITGAFAASQATFGDAIGEMGYTKMDGYRLSDDSVRNIIRRQREGGAEIVAADATSQNEYGPRSESTSGTQETSDVSVTDRANYRLAHAKDALSYVNKLELEPRKNAATLFPVVLGALELQSRITLKRRPQNLGAVISKEAIIQGLEHDIGPKKWTTRFYVDTSAAQRYFLFDTTLWGSPRLEIFCIVTASYSSPPTAVAGQPLSAADWNSKVRDSLDAVFTPPACKAHNNVPTSILNNTQPTLTFNSETFDNDGMHDPVTNNSRITINKAGLYLCILQVQFSANITGIRAIYIRHHFAGGSGDILQVAQEAVSGATVTVMGGSVVHPFSAGDYITALAFQNSGATLDLEVAGHSPLLTAIRVSG